MANSENVDIPEKCRDYEFSSWKNNIYCWEGLEKCYLMVMFSEMVTETLTLSFFCLVIHSRIANLNSMVYF